MHYKLVIFDMDGTLLNTIEDLADSVNVVLSQYNYPQHSIAEIQSYVGNGIKMLIKRAVPVETEENTVLALFNIFKNYYSNHSTIKTHPYDGIINFLTELHILGVKLAVVSNKNDEALQNLCNVFFPNLFDAVIGIKNGIKLKPAPDSLNLIINRFKIAKNQALYVGDSEVDIETARNANIDICSVTWGFKTKSFLAKHGANLFADSVQELKQICNRSHT